MNESENNQQELRTYRTLEPEIMQRILAWQIAQTLGYEDEIAAQEHAVLLLIDYDENRMYPKMVGSAFRDAFLPDDAPADWEQLVTHIAQTYVEEDSRAAVAQFWSPVAARRKFEKQRYFDAIEFLSTMNGAMKWVRQVQYLLRDPATGHLMSYCWAIEVDTYRKNQAAILRMAQHDPLTGLYNRHKLYEITHDSVVLRSGGTVVFILADINLFKQINDTYGHSAGDHALKTLAARLERIFPRKKKDLIFRLGGDEFLVIMLDTDEAQARQCMEQMLQPVHAEYESGNSFDITLSVGYSICTDGDVDSKIYMKAADEALYRVKKNGRHGFLRGEPGGAPAEEREG